MTACPDDDTLGALVHRALDDQETERVTSHLDECAACRDIMVAAVRSAGTPADHRAGGPTVTAAIGTRIGRYEVRTLLGAGGMGHVYEAYDRELDRAIALKVLRPGLAGSAVMLAERLMRESRLMAKVVHPAVITVHDVGREDDAVFIAMELIRGETLAAYVARSPRSWREIATLYEQAGEGLIAAHRAGVVHRDFKPDNVLVEAGTQRVVVTDFGIARAIAHGDEGERGAPAALADVSLTAAGVAIGTPAYMAPEQLAATGVVDARADVFAFAVSMWESLFGERPVPGATVADIRRAMENRPRAPHRRVPGRLVALLERGLAIDPDERWPDLAVLIRQLAAVRSSRRRIQLAAAAAGLVGVGIVGALALAGPTRGEDPCARGLDELAVIYDARRAVVLHARLASDPQAGTLVQTIDDRVAAWRATHRATCDAAREPVQNPTTTACLDARRLELAGYVADLVADGPRHATAHARTVGDPAACGQPAPSLASANVPDDPALRRRVKALRYRIYDVSLALDRGEIAAALAGAGPIVALARATWPRVHAEALFQLGTTQVQAGDAKQAARTFQEAAATAQAAHHDYVAASSWIELMASATFDDGDPTRGLEYLPLAQAATDRIGRPARLEALLAYVKGATLIEANRSPEAEVALRRAIELGETTAPEQLPAAIQGLGYLHERQGNYAAAVAAYRRAIDHLAASGRGGTADDAVFRTRIANNLAIIGKGDEAEAEARRAVELADRIFALDHTDRAVAHKTLAKVLHTSGKLEAALVVAQATLREVAKTRGERSKDYAEALGIEGEILDSLRRYPEAQTALARSCDILAFEAGEDSTALAACRIPETLALSHLGRSAEALALLDKALPLLIAGYGGEHPLVANALIARGALHVDLGHPAPAVKDLEQAIALLERVPFDPGLLGSAQLALAKQLWPHDRARARQLLEASAVRLAGAPAIWSGARDEAARWLAR